MRFKRLFLALYILLSIVDISMVILNQKDFLWFFRIVSLTVLFLFMYFSIKRVYKSFYVLSFFILLTGFLFSLDDYTVFGMLSLIALRLSWAKQILDLSRKKIDFKLSLVVFSVSMLLIGVVLFALFTNTLFYYLSIGTTTSLLILLALSFSLLLTQGGKSGNKEMVIAVAIFILSDTLSGAKKIHGTSSIFLAISVLLYNSAYVFLAYALIKKYAKNVLNKY